MAEGLVRRNQLGRRGKEKRIREKLAVSLFERLCKNKNIMLNNEWL